MPTAPMTCIDRDDIESASEDEELTPEAGQSGQTKAGKAGHRKDAVIVGHLGAQAAKGFQVTRMGAFVDHPHQEEQAARDDAVS